MIFLRAAKWGKVAGSAGGILHVLRNLREKLHLRLDSPDSGNRDAVKSNPNATIVVKGDPSTFLGGD